MNGISIHRALSLNIICTLSKKNSPEVTYSSSSTALQSLHYSASREDFPGWPQGKSIGVLDRVPDVFHEVETLFLSNNALRSLQGIGQFTRLKVLSVANNCLSSFSDLDALKPGAPLPPKQ